jgi:multidrug efflux pump
MISYFFIDRPIFASVLSIVITLTGAIALFWLPLDQYPPITPPQIQVMIAYPGANSQVVADTVAAPIEQQVNGIQGMLYMSSQSSNDGTYTLTVTFDLGTNLNTALVMVQNRVTLAMPQLPPSVQKQGITIRKKTPTILMIVNLFSPDGRYDNLYLSNYATIHLQDEIYRVPGVTQITYLGPRTYSIRAWLDPQKMAAHGIAASDVANAIRTQNIEAPVGGIGLRPARRGQSFDLTLDTLGRLTTKEQFGNIVVKVGQPPQPRMTSVLPAPAAQAVAAPVNLPALGTGSGGTTTTVPSPGPGAVGTPSLGGGAAPGGLSPIGSGTTSTSPGGLKPIGSGTPGTSPGGLSPIGNSTASNAVSIAPASTSYAIGTSSFPPGGGMPGRGGMTNSVSILSGGATTGGSVTAIAGGGVSMSNATTTGATVGAGVLSGGASSSGIPPSSTPLVRLRDVARVDLGAQNYNLGCTFDGRPSVGLSIFQLPGTNALEVADRVRQKLEELKTRFPDGVDYDVAYDTTPYIRESVLDVVRTLIEAVVLVALVVLLFLQNWRAAVIPLIAVPVGIIGTLAVMAALSFSLNNISLFGLVLAIGIVVDDAIVVVENVERWLEHGLEPREAARKAMDEVTGPVIAVALVLVAVFVPCAFLGGVSGQFFRQFAVTIAVSTVFSAFNSLTLSPALAAILLKKRGAKRDPLTWLLEIALGWFFRLFNWTFNVGTAIYTRWVGWLLRLSVVVLLVYGGLLYLTYAEMVRVPKGFIPQQDKGYLMLNMQLPDSASVERTQKVMAHIEKIALDMPGVAHTVGVSGQSLILNANAPNLGSMYVLLKPFSQRTSADLSANAIAITLRDRCRKEVRGAVVSLFGSPPIEGLGTTSGFKLIIEDRGNQGLSELQRVSDAIVAQGNRTPGLQGLFSGSRANTPWLYLDIDRDKCLTLGVPVSDVFNTLQNYLGGFYVNNFNEFGRTWQVNLQADARYRDRVRAIRQLQVKNNQRQMIELGTLLKVRSTSGPVLVTTYNLYGAVAITGNAAPGTSSSQAVSLMEQLAKQKLPRSMAYDWTELTYLQNQTGNTAIYVFALAVVFVFLVLAAQYESWMLPLAVILVVPMCLLCSAVGVELGRLELTVFTQIGFVVLVGLASKNAILIVEFARQQQQGGVPVREATLEACRLRLRPILMTSFAFILGVVPLVIATGAGSEMRRSLGTAVFAGMLGVTFFGIFLTPVFYFVLGWFGRVKSAPEQAPSEKPPPSSYSTVILVRPTGVWNGVETRLTGIESTKSTQIFSVSSPGVRTADTGDINRPC